MAVNKKTGTMKNPVKFQTMKLDNLVVKYSHITKPDLVYNSGHSVMVEWTKELQKMFNEIVKQSGVDKVNGLKKEIGGKIKRCDLKDGPEYVTFKNKLFVLEGIERFPDVFDKDGQRTMDDPWSGDEVNLYVRPKVIDKGDTPSVSVYLNQIQIEKKDSGSSATFERIQKEPQFGQGVNKHTESKQESDNEEDLPF
tara:strand:+ start:95 stop:682 length:588 start_codon:yes stop_codon:yes gene_type:complete